MYLNAWASSRMGGRGFSTLQPLMSGWRRPYDPPYRSSWRSLRWMRTPVQSGRRACSGLRLSYQSSGPPAPSGTGWPPFMLSLLRDVDVPPQQGTRRTVESLRLSTCVFRGTMSTEYVVGPCRTLHRALTPIESHNTSSSDKLFASRPAGGESCRCAAR